MGRGVDQALVPGRRVGARDSRARPLSRHPTWPSRPSGSPPTPEPLSPGAEGMEGRTGSPLFRRQSPLRPCRPRPLSQDATSGRLLPDPTASAFGRSPPIGYPRRRERTYPGRSLRGRSVRLSRSHRCLPRQVGLRDRDVEPHGSPHRGGRRATGPSAASRASTAASASPQSSARTSPSWTPASRPDRFARRVASRRPRP